MRIIIDTKERKPWTFKGYDVRITNSCLMEFGSDYSIYGMRDLVGIERKAWPDLLLSVGKNWPRFQKSLRKLRKLKHRIIIVEGNLNWPIRHSRMTHDFLVDRIVQITSNRIPVLFASNRKRAEQAAFMFFQRVIKNVRES